MNSDLTIQDELTALNSILAGIPNTNVYTVPDGYFEAMVKDLLHTVQQQTDIKANTDVPDGYFDGLAAVIMNKIKSGSALEEEASPVLLSLKNNRTYGVPQGYFDGLANAQQRRHYSDTRNYCRISGGEDLSGYEL